MSTKPGQLQSRGGVIGLVGTWGSGKSSVLAMLRENLEADGVVVIPFNPWLVSNRDDLIGEFFRELAARIREAGTTNPNTGEQFTELARRIAKYGAKLTSFAGSVGVPGAEVAQAGLEAVGQFLGSGHSLDSLRDGLSKEMLGVKVPFVVLIDELDRVEDPEVRAVAQLVRAVADFQGLSYLLAYDEMRVAEALGSGSLERGRRYLEKIVQIQVPMPEPFADQLVDQLLAEFGNLAAVKLIPENWRDDDRFRELVGILVPDVLDTPRDLKRLVGHLARIMHQRPEVPASAW